MKIRKEIKEENQMRINSFKNRKKKKKNEEIKKNLSTRTKKK